MKQNYNIKKDLPELSADQINQHQDFDSLFAQFEQAVPEPEPQDLAKTATEQPVTAVAKSPWLFKAVIGVGITIAAAALIVFMIQKGLPSEQPTAQLKEDISLLSPLPDWSPAFERQLVLDSKKGQVLEYPNGTQIVIPADAFVDAAGELVVGQVAIAYRVLGSPVDKFLAGVPQDIQQQAGLETEIVIELKAYHEERPVYLNADKVIEVLVQTQSRTDLTNSQLQIYVYNHAESDWQRQATDQTAVVASEREYTPEMIAEKETFIKKAWASQKPRRPIKPQTVPKGMEVFDIDIDAKEFPKLAYLDKNVGFLVNSKDVANDPFAIAWNDIKLEELNEDYLQLKLSQTTNGNTTKELKLNIMPYIAYSAAAEKHYQEQLLAYEGALHNWQKDQDAALEELYANQKQILQHRFEANRLGLWAVASPIDVQGKPVAIVQLNGDKSTEIATIFVTMPNQNQYYSYAVAAKSTTIELPANVQAAQVWALTYNKELLIATVSQNAETNQLEMDFVSRGLVTSEEQVRAALAF